MLKNQINKLIASFIFLFMTSTILCVNAEPVNNKIKETPTKNTKSKESLAVDNQALMAKLRLLLRSDIYSIKPSAMPGLLEVLSDNGFSYISDDGEFLFMENELYGIGNDFQRYTENSRVALRLDGMKKFADDMIVYPAEDEKYVVTVFTDITCGYCRKLHHEISDYNDLGITIRYLAYPRYGLVDRQGKPSEGFKDMRSIWCNDDPVKMLTKAKSGGNIPKRTCETSIEGQFTLGRQVGVSGTPALIFPDGRLISGYLPPEALLNTLQNQ